MLKKSADLLRQHLHCNCRRYSCSSIKDWQGKHIQSADVRNNFIEYFIQKHDHVYVPSSPVHVTADPNLLYVPAGMNQFKPIFLGTVTPDSPLAKYRRVVNSQKCIRVGGKHNDLDAVGKDGSHHTFFEMLGSWSFADYSKKDACAMAWELLTQVYRIPKNRLYVTYFGGDESSGLKADDECRNIWLQLGLSAERILPFGMKDNFWDMGSTGPCGPCTEIHYVHTLKDDSRNLVNKDDPSVVEVWNLVFMQYERIKDGKLKKLPAQHVDTGMGLERLCAILNGSQSNYDTDLFHPIFQAIHKHSKVSPYQGTFGMTEASRIDSSYRMLADHARMFTVSIADGVMPSSTGVGYPLRKIIHRAVLQSKHVLGFDRGNVGRLSESVIASLGVAYPELENQSKKVLEIVNEEEYLFYNKIEELHERLDNDFKELLAKNITVFPGELMLVYCHGRGFPFDLLVDLIAVKGFKPDIEKFNKLMLEEKVKSRHAHDAKLKGECFATLDQDAVDTLKSMRIPATDDSHKYRYQKQVNKYAFTNVSANLLAIWRQGEFVNELNEGEKGVLIFNKTTFYHEAGGQMYDLGVVSQDESKFDVQRVSAAQGYVFHHGMVVSGIIANLKNSTLKINEENRVACMRNHSATHILVRALEQILGPVNPQSFWCDSKHLKMDFTSLGKITIQNLQDIETFAMDLINSNSKVVVKFVSRSDVFSESSNIKTYDRMDYPDLVRVVTIGNDSSMSMEACCGTHVLNSSDIMKFVITSQNSSGKNMKRIKAVTGYHAKNVLAFCNEQLKQYQDLQLRYENAVNQPKYLDEKSLSDMEFQIKNIRKSMQDNEMSLIIRTELESKLKQLHNQITKTMKELDLKKKQMTR